MKTKKVFDKLLKIGALNIIFGLILGSVAIFPTVEAKIRYETLAYDKKLEKAADFEKGEFRNIRMSESGMGVELEQSGDGKGEYVTPEIEAPFGATHLGLHWKEKNAGDALLSVQVRTRNGGEEYGGWTDVAVETDEGKDGGRDEEIFSTLVGVGNDNFAQAKISFDSKGEKKTKLENFTFTFINSGEEAKRVSKKLSFAPKSIAEVSGTLKVSPNGQNVSVISREDWGADESLRQDADGGEDWPRSYHGTRKLVIHHTGDPASNGETDPEKNKATLRAIYHYHAITRAWGDIGYNALVDAVGNVYEGRYGTYGESFWRTDPTADQIMALDVEGAHAASYNAGSFGVSALGDFTNFEVPTNQREGLKRVLAFVADSRGIDVQGSSDFLRYDGAWHNGLGNVFAHGDVSATACPGDNLYSQIASIKSEIGELPGMVGNIEGFSATSDDISISGKTVGSGNLSFAWNDFTGAGGYQYALEKVFGSVYDPQPWETAWMNDANSAFLSNPNVSLDASALDGFSQYVFYVRALDGTGKAVSNAKHVNFKTGDMSTRDTDAPQVSILSPTEGYEASQKEKLAVSVVASDNSAVVKIEIFLDGKLKYSCNNATTCDTVVQMQRENAGSHTIEAKASDSEGNFGTAIVNFTKAGSTSDEPDSPTPEKCSPWPSCKKN